MITVFLAFEFLHKLTQTQISNLTFSHLPPGPTELVTFTKPQCPLFPLLRPSSNVKLTPELVYHQLPQTLCSFFSAGMFYIWLNLLIYKSSLIKSDSQENP